MTTRGKRGTLINPERVTDLQSWVRYYRSKYQNLKINEDGNPVVLNPENLAEVAKVLTIPRGVDALRILSVYNERKTPELREKYTTAVQYLQQLEVTRRDNVALQTQALQEATQHLAEAYALYRQRPSNEDARRVAEAQKALNELEKEYAKPAERIVKEFQYSAIPLGNVPPPPAFFYFRDNETVESREIKIGE